MHSHDTRHKNDFKITFKIKTNYFKNTFQYVGASIQKNWPKFVNVAQTYVGYKNLFKNHCTSRLYQCDKIL